MEKSSDSQIGNVFTDETNITFILYTCIVSQEILVSFLTHDAIDSCCSG
jgi:hypothetical protein